MKKIIENKWLLLILFFAFLVRFIGVPEFPVGFTQDEAGIGYDAYSILQTGKDHWGEIFPLVLRSFGDFKLPLYSYLSIPAIFIFGLNVFSVRLVGVIFGTLAVYATYLMTEKVSGRKKLALWSALLLSLSPWHMPMSRGAFEANLTTFFIPMGVYFFYKGLEQRKWMIIAALSFGLNLFSYHSARLITPLIILGLVFFNCDHFRKDTLFKGVKEGILKYRWSIGLFFIFVFLVVLTMFSGANNRALDITIFNPTDGWFAMSEKRFYIITSGLDMNIARLFINKYSFTYEQFIRNYLKYLSPQFLFTEGVADWSYGMLPGRGVLYLFEAITVLAGIVGIIRGKGFRNAKFFLFWILVSPLPAALTKGGGAAGTRATVMMPAIQILSAFGLIYFSKVIGKFNSSLITTRRLRVIALVVITISFSKFLVDYVYYYPIQAAESMQTGRDEMAEYLAEVDDNYEMVRVSRSLGVPHIWMMFYQKRDPEDVQKYSGDWLVYEKEGLVSIDQYDGYRLGNYVFGNIYYENRLNEENTLFVGRPEDFPQEVTPMRVINDSNAKPSVYIVESVGKVLN